LTIATMISFRVYPQRENDSGVSMGHRVWALSASMLTTGEGGQS